MDPAATQLVDLSAVRAAVAKPCSWIAHHSPYQLIAVWQAHLMHNSSHKYACLSCIGRLHVPYMAASLSAGGALVSLMSKNGTVAGLFVVNRRWAGHLTHVAGKQRLHIC